MCPTSPSLRVKISVILSSLLLIATAFTLLNAGKLTSTARAAGTSGSPGVKTNWTTDGFDFQRTHYNPDENTINVSNVNTLTRKWTVQTSTLFTEPTYSNGVLYQGDTVGTVTAYNASTGAVLWTQQVGQNFVSSPTVINGIVYTGSGKLFQNSEGGFVYALNATTGAVIWHAYIMPDRKDRQIRSAPVVVNGIVYIATVYGDIYAYNAAGCGHLTCPPLWHAFTPGYTDSSMAYDNGDLFIGTGFGIYALNTQTQKIVWMTKTDSFVFAAPAVANGIVYDASFNTFYALNEQTGAIIWTFPHGGSGTAAIYNGVAYLGAGKLYAFNAQTGAVLWTAPKTQKPAYQNVIVANGVLYAGEKYLYAFNAAGCGQATCSPLWTSPSAVPLSNPIVVNGYVYAPSYYPTNKLFAYHLPK